MRILLDECVPVKFARDIPGHEVRTVRRMGWGSLKNGELLRQAASQFDVFLTIDQGIRHQQVAPGRLALVTLQAASNDIDYIRPLVPALLRALTSLKPNDDIVISAAD